MLTLLPKARFVFLGKFLFLVDFFLLGGAYGQIGVLADPPHNNIVVEAGETSNQTITIGNPSNNTVHLRLYLSDWTLDPQGNPTFVQELGNLPHSASPWITFNPSELVLEPHQKSTVRYSVDVPSDAEPGTHWSMLFIHTHHPERDPRTMVGFNTRVGHTIYVSVPPIEQKGAINGVFGERIDEEGIYRLTVQYTNIGNSGQMIEAYFDLRDTSGETVISSEPKERGLVLPQSQRVFSFDLGAPIEEGQYTALIIVNYGDETTDLAVDYSFTLDSPILGSQENQELSSLEEGYE